MIIAVLTTLVMGFLVVPQPASAKLKIFNVSSALAMEPDDRNLGVLSEGETVSTNITIAYIYNKFALPKGIFMLSPAPTKIEITVESKPSWCDVELEKTELSADIPLNAVLLGGNETFRVRVNVSLTSRDAPGYEEGIIVIKAKAEKNGNINASEAECRIRVKPDFFADIAVSENYFDLSLSPGDEETVFVDITNKANMDIVASIDIDETILPDILEISVPESIEIGVKDTERVQIEIRAKEYDGKINERYTIPLVLSYHAKDYSELKGESVNIDLDVRVKGEAKNSFNILDPVIIEGIIIVVLIIALIAVVVRYRA